VVEGVEDGMASFNDCPRLGLGASPRNWAAIMAMVLDVEFIAGQNTE